MTIRRLSLIVVVSGCAGLGMYLAFFGRPSADPVVPISPPPAVVSDVVSAEHGEQIRVFCGNCHRVPSPDFFPKNAWYKEVQRGFGFYTDSGRSLPLCDSNSINCSVVFDLECRLFNRLPSAV